MSKIVDLQKLFELENLENLLGEQGQQGKFDPEALNALPGGANGDLAGMVKFLMEPQLIESFIDMADQMVKIMETDGKPGITADEAIEGIKGLLNKDGKLQGEAKENFDTMVEEKVKELFGDRDVLPVKQFFDDFRDAMKARDQQEEGEAKGDGKIDMQGASKAFIEALTGKELPDGPVNPQLLPGENGIPDIPRR